MPVGLDLKICDKLLTTTRSVRQRLDFSRPIEPELIEECIDIALQPPSSTNTQLWQFVVVTAADKRAAFCLLHRRRFQGGGA
jgi:nitroreductase